MSQILFRAKRKDNGEWVTGDLLRETTLTEEIITRIYEAKAHGTYIKYEVDPETVCQYTGMDDEIGKKIFKGDIVKTLDDDEIYVVEWNKDTARYVMEQAGFIMCDFTNYWASEIEVIGNIFDNPELLEEG